jgi:hypothetical protein
VFGIEPRKDPPATVGAIIELHQKGSQQAPDIAFGGIAKVKVIVSDQGWP